MESLLNFFKIGFSIERIQTTHFKSFMLHGDSFIEISIRYIDGLSDIQDATAS